MLTPFHAKVYIAEIRAFMDLCLSYWRELPDNQPRDFDVRIGAKRKESKESRLLRQQISQRIPHIEFICSQIGYDPRMQFARLPDGLSFTVDVLAAIIKDVVVPERMSREEIYDVLKRIEGECEVALRKAWIYWLQPWNWVIEFAAFIVRIPFLILRRVGLPPSIEENILSQILKIVSTIILLLLIAYFGLEKIGIGITDILKIFSK
jgi:hypothetical protein